MKAVSIAAAGVSLALIALTLVPSAGDYRAYFAIGAFICAALVLAAVVFGWRERPAGAAVSPQPDGPSRPSTVSAAAYPTTEVVAPSPLVPKAAAPTPKETSAEVSVEAEIAGFLSTLQEKGRLVDFLQDDITRYTDAQVGAAARVVHQGCKVVLDEYFRIVPIREESEGTKVLLPAGYATDEYRLVGKISGQAPFSGTLMHRGWKTQSVQLPRVLRTGGDRFPTIAPAEVELR